jgi:predicted DNA-binding protein (UPF0251 family)
MVRPRKRRRVRWMPGQATFYKPAGIPMRDLPISNLNIEEVEALRLKNIKELDNRQAAKKMEISRATFQRVLKSAYKKVSKALVSGQAIRIEGGAYFKK